MTSKTKPTVSAAIDADNDITSPLDFSYKCLAGIQGLFWYSIRYQLHFSLFRKALIFFVIVFLTFYRCYGRRAESRSSQIYPRGGNLQKFTATSVSSQNPLFPPAGWGRGAYFTDRRTPNDFEVQISVTCMPQGGDHRLGWGGDQQYNFGVEIPHTRAKVPHCGLKCPGVHREFEWHQSRDQPQPEKTADILQRHYRFPRKMMTDK